MKKLDYKIQGQKSILGYFRQNKDIVKFINILCSRYNLLQSVVIYLLAVYKIKEARGKWLDYIGLEVGAKRDEADFGNYFVVNQPQINTEKLFYFLSSGINPRNTLSLDDSEFIKKIFAYIAANNSSGTLEDIIFTLKSALEADNVELVKHSPSNLSLKLIGESMRRTRKTNEICAQTVAEGTYIKEIL